MEPHNVFDGTTTRPMTDEEHAQHLLDVLDIAARKQDLADAAAARASGLAKLKALGLTDAEVAALVGG